MKKTVAVLFLTFTSFLGSAQTAPDFTETDINSNTHTLNTYLSQGKLVIIDFFTTWCGPCQALHDKHILKDFYNLYGPNGSNQAMVMAIESDMFTSVSDLSTPYDWVTGITYPIIDDADESTVNLYKAFGYPTLVLICPGGDAYGAPQFSGAPYANDMSLYYANLNSVNDLKNIVESRCNLTLNPLSIENLESSDILSVYLNSSGQLEMTSGVHDEVIEVDIYNISGQRIKSLKIEPGLSSSSVDMSSYPSNIYFYKFMYKGEVFTNKFALYR